MAERYNEFSIEAAVIFGERVEAAVDVSKLVLELSLFEDIDLPYLSGQIVCMDDSGTFDRLALMGTEQIYLSIVNQDGGMARIRLNMHIVSVVNRTKTTDRAEVYHLNLVSPIAFQDQGIKISKSYTGKLEDISEKVVKNHFSGMNVSFDYAGNVAQSSVKVITPYISPLETAKWLLDRATEFSGAPFFLWQSIYEQDPGSETIRIGDLESMMTKKFNPDGLKLVYSQSEAMKVALEGTIDQKNVVKQMTSNNVADTMNTMADGAVGARFSTVDTYTSQMYSRHFDSKLMLDRAKDDVMAGTKKQNVVDEQKMLTYEGETKAINEWDHRHFDVLTSYGTYGPWNSYHDDPRQLDAMNKMRSQAFHNLLQKNPVEIVAAGAAFFHQGSPGAGAGDVINLKVLVSESHVPGGDENPPPRNDENRSGYYLIKKCRHTFANTIHNVSAQLVKLDKGDTT